VKALAAESVMRAGHTWCWLQR